MPGASRASANGLPSESGIIAIVFSPMTWPVDPDVVASSGDSAVTDTVSSIRADVERQVDVELLADAHLDVLAATTFLKPESSAVTRIGAGIQEEDRVVPFAVGRRGRRDVGGDVGGGDRHARHAGVLRVEDAAR